MRWRRGWQTRRSGCRRDRRGAGQAGGAARRAHSGAVGRGAREQGRGAEVGQAGLSGWAESEARGPFKENDLFQILFSPKFIQMNF